MNRISDIAERFAGKGVYPHQLAWVLLVPLRNLYLSPSKLIKRLNLKKNSIILEIGCGPGYFSPAIAKSIPEGKLYMTDVQPEMIEKAERRIRKHNIPNAELQVCNGDDLPYTDEMFDVVFLVTVPGEIEKKESCVREIHRTLRKGGVLSISEQAGDPDSLSVDEIKELLVPAGFSLDRVYGKGRTCTANFRKE